MNSSRLSPVIGVAAQRVGGAHVRLRDVALPAAPHDRVAGAQQRREAGVRRRAADQRAAADKALQSQLRAAVDRIVEQHAARAAGRLRAQDHDVGRVVDVAVGVLGHVGDVDDAGIVGMRRQQAAMDDARDDRVRPRRAGRRRAVVGVDAGQHLEPVDDAGGPRRRRHGGRRKQRGLLARIGVAGGEERRCDAKESEVHHGDGWMLSAWSGNWEAGKASRRPRFFLGWIQTGKE